MKDITVRKMKQNEKGGVKAVVKKAFPFLIRLFFYFTKNIIVAESDGKIVGGAVLTLFNINRSLKGGVICFIFTSPEAKGKGIGQKLTDFSLDFFRDSGCSEIFSMVEGDNTSSSKLFSNRGFRILNPLEQIKRYGFKTLKVWINTYHMFDIGHFMWVKSDKPSPETKSSQWISTIILHATIFQLMIIRNGNNIGLKAFLTVVISFSVIFGLRHISMLLSAGIQKMKVEYKMWESGILLNLIITVVFGGFVPSPGSLYPVKDNWSYRDYKNQLGKMALTSSIVLVSLLLGLKAILLFKLYSDFHYYINTAYIILSSLAVIDICLPFFPISPYNGKRIWEMNKLIWVLITIPVICQFFI